MGCVPPPQIHVPPARPAHLRQLGPLLPLAGLLPGPVHYAMAGGGSHGAVQWGLLQALAETDLVPDALIGTSAGALSGAVYAEDPVCGINRLAYVWAQLDTKFLVGESWWGNLTNARQIALVDNAAVRETLSTILTCIEFADLAMPFAAVATDLATGRATVIDSGPLIPALLASSAIPGLLPPVQIDGRLFVDGLASANLPAVQAVRRGAGAVVALDTGAREPTELSTASRKVISRLAVVLASTQRREQLHDAALQVPVLLLPTPENLGGTLDFTVTMSAAREAYMLARQFLADLVTLYRGPLAPGLYARPGGPGLGSLADGVLRPVAP